jgi:diguanylate cyclase (GGDEF)-like protein
MSTTAEALVSFTGLDDRKTLTALYLGDDSSCIRSIEKKMGSLRIMKSGSQRREDFYDECREADILFIEASPLNGDLLPLLRELRHRAPDSPVIILEESGDSELSGKLLRAGAQDFLTKKQLASHRFIDSLVKAIDRQHYLKRIEDVHRIERYLAYHDTLTKLPNRQLFFDRLKQAIAKAKRKTRPIAVLFIDLDGFKEVNDTRGHEVGDTLLVAVADRLKKCIRESETAARFGGDEFAVILSEIESPGDASVVADRILTAFARPIDVAGDSLRIGASIGISIFPEDGADSYSLIRHADGAMYRSKSQGGRRYLYYSGLTTSS